MFKYIFGITWKEYTKTQLDIENALTLVISFLVSIFLFHWWGLLVWFIFMVGARAGGGAWLIK